MPASPTFSSGSRATPTLCASERRFAGGTTRRDKVPPTGMHYIYTDAPDAASLNQGDVLTRTPELDAVLTEYHPHYARHPSYRYFLVLTQSCDLVRRKGVPPDARYISIGAV